MRVVLAGVGGVGASLAFNLLVGPDEHEIVLVDPRGPIVAAHVKDFEQVLELGASGTVRVGEVDEIAEADVVVVTASVPLRPNASRDVFLGENAELIGRYADVIAAYGPQWPGVVVMVTNPVDPLVMLTAARTGLDRRQVLGYTINDTLRLRTGIGQTLGRPPGSVEAWVVGEHGDGAVPLLSRVRVDGAPVTLSAAEQDQARDYLHGWYVRVVALDPTRSSTWTSGRGVSQLVTALGRDEPTLMPASVMLDGEYGLHGVSLTVPVMLGRGGVHEILEWELEDAEAQGLRDAAQIVATAAAPFTG